MISVWNATPRELCQLYFTHFCFWCLNLRVRNSQTNTSATTTTTKARTTSGSGVWLCWKCWYVLITNTCWVVGLILSFNLIRTLCLFFSNSLFCAEREFFCYFGKMHETKEKSRKVKQVGERPCVYVCVYNLFMCVPNILSANLLISITGYHFPIYIWVCVCTSS